jgi:hypothetical protein
VITEEMLRDMEASESPEARAMAQTLRQNQATRARIEAEYRAAGNWNGLLGLAGSENRAAVLVEALEATPGKEGKTELLRLTGSAAATPSCRSVSSCALTWSRRRSSRTKRAPR